MHKNPHSYPRLSSLTCVTGSPYVKSTDAGPWRWKSSCLPPTVCHSFNGSLRTTGVRKCCETISKRSPIATTKRDIAKPSKKEGEFLHARTREPHLRHSTTRVCSPACATGFVMTGQMLYCALFGTLNENTGFAMYVQRLQFPQQVQSGEILYVIQTALVTSVAEHAGTAD